MTQTESYTQKVFNIVHANQIELAIDLVRSLNNKKLFEELLKDCTIFSDAHIYHKGLIISPNTNHGGPDLRKFYLELISCCPVEANIHKSIRRENVNALILCQLESFENLQVLSCFTNLTSLEISSNNLFDLNGLATLTKLTSLRICSDALYDISLVGNLLNLTNISIVSNSLMNVDALSNLHNLIKLNIQCWSMENFDGLTLLGLTKLNSLNLQCKSATNIDSLKKFLPNVKISYLLSS